MQRIVLGQPEEAGAKESKTNNPGNGQRDPNQNQDAEITTTTARKLYTLTPKLGFMSKTSLVIDEIKVTLITKNFGSEVIRSMLIKDIGGVMWSGNFLFAALTILHSDAKGKIEEFTQDKMPLFINFLGPEGARTARRILLGLTILGSQKMDTSKMTEEEIKTKAEELGRGR